MKYDFGLISPSRLSLRADPSNAMPVRSRSSFSTASGGTFGKRSIRDSRSAVREPEARSLTPSRYRLGTVIARLNDVCSYADGP